MQVSLYIAAVLAVAIAVAHSYLGERFILKRLFRRQEAIPTLFGGTEFTVRMLRFAWHVTSVAWWGFAALLILLAHPPVDVSVMGMVIGVTFLVHFVIALAGSNGRHLSWLVFLAIAVIAIYATRG